MKVGIIGSHGLYAKYGGWDQLVNNLAENASPSCEFIIFNPKETPIKKNTIPKNVQVISIFLSASGFAGLLFDFISIFIASLYCKKIFLLGLKGMPAAIIVKIISFNKIKLISNIGGIEWERPQFSWIQKRYLKFCFHLANKFCNKIVLDNEHYLRFYKEDVESRKKLCLIPYGGTIDTSISKDDSYLVKKYPFLKFNYFLSVGRSIEDNMLDELCTYFKKKPKANLVLISNFSNSIYGRHMLQKFSSFPNIYLIDGLYVKSELDFLRRCCHAYIHTHTLCGSAPSLIEMMIAKRPILSIDVPQNRFTLKGCGFLFKEFNILDGLLHQEDLSDYICSTSVASLYEWPNIVSQYQNCFHEA